MRHAVIIAGGYGKRLWPKSRAVFPKFLLNLTGRKTLLQETVSRVRKFIPKDNIIVITNKEHVNLVYKQLSGFSRRNIIAEPVSRNTAAAVSIAASLVKRRDPHAVLFVLPADHVIEDSSAIAEIFSFASFTAGISDSIITLGIKPTYPSCGFGYIKSAGLYKNLISGKRRYSIYKVDKFVEKPDLKRARRFLASKKYLWNSGIFIAKAKVFLDEFKRHSPRVYRITERIEKGLGTKREKSLIGRYYKDFPNISIDYALMEKTNRAYVVRSDILWKDIGSWKSMDEYLKKDAKGNIVSGDCVGLDIKDSIVLSDKGLLTAVIGLKGTIIVHTKDATLICPKDRADEVKGLVEAAEKKGLGRYL